MTRCKTSFVALVVCVLAVVATFPVLASEPDGLAGEMISHSWPPSPDYCPPYFLWQHSSQGGPLPLDSTDTVTVEFAIVPFASGTTFAKISMGGGPYLPADPVALRFRDGVLSVNDGPQLSYDRNGWNSILVDLNQSRREFEVTVNGTRVGPFPYAFFCHDLEGACTSLEKLDITGLDIPGGGTGWVDSVRIVRHVTDSDELFYAFDANPCTDHPLVAGGGVIFLEPPKKLHSGK